VETGELRYYHSSQNNSRFVDAPHLIRTEEDLERLNNGKSRDCLCRHHSIHQLKQRQLCFSKYGLEERLWHQSGGQTASLHDMTVSTFPEMVRRIFRQQTTAFKINLSFGFILRNVETGELRYYHSSQNNSRFFDAPHLIRTEEDLERRRSRWLGGAPPIWCQDVAGEYTLTYHVGSTPLETSPSLLLF
jgi:hypothetical protein